MEKQNGDWESGFAKWFDVCIGISEMGDSIFSFLWLLMIDGGIFLFDSLVEKK